MNTRPLSKSLQIKAEVELNEVSKNIKDDIEYIRDWLKQQPHLNVDPDDQFILSFLRGSKFKYDIAKQRIDAYYSTKTLIPEYLQHRNPTSPEIHHCLVTGRFWVPLPKLSDPLAPRLLFNCGEPLQPSEKVNMIGIIKTILIVLDILLHEDDSFIVNGYCVFESIAGFSINHLSQITLKMLKNSYDCLVKRYPTRMKGYHYINASSGVRAMYNLFKILLPQKLQSRVYFSDTEDYKYIHELYPKEELPIELGGKGYSVKTVKDEWKTKIENYGNWLMEDERICSDESKRIGKVNYDTDIFGLQGTFKRLEVD